MKIHVIKLIFLLSAAAGCAVNDAVKTEDILKTISETRTLIEKNNPGLRYRFITFWDFDGTIIKGDCLSESARGQAGVSHDKRRNASVGIQGHFLSLRIQ